MVTQAPPYSSFAVVLLSTTVEVSMLKQSSDMYLFHLLGDTNLYLPPMYLRCFGLMALGIVPVGHSAHSQCTKTWDPG